VPVGYRLRKGAPENRLINGFRSASHTLERLFIRKMEKIKRVCSETVLRKVSLNHQVEVLGLGPQSHFGL